MQADLGAEPAESAALKTTRLWSLIEKLHAGVPRTLRLRFQANVRESLRVMSVQGAIPTGSGCSGTGIALHGWRSLVLWWYEQLGTEVRDVREQIAAEKESGKQAFLDAQHDIVTLLGDVASLDSARVVDVRGGRPKHLPECSLYGGGFSCESVCNQNNARGSNVGCVRANVGTTGETFHFIAKYVHRVRPKLTLLENVPALGVPYEVDQLPTDDIEYIVTWFQERGFTCIHVEMSARDVGACKELIRLWFVIWYVPTFAAESLQVVDNFWSVFNALRLAPDESGSPESYLFEDSVLLDYVKDEPYGLESPPHRRWKADLKWKDTHEELFSEARIAWPPYTSALVGLNREGELVVLADELFPAPRPGWTFMDANHSAERTFRMTQTNVRANPWREHVPTCTGLSAIACRQTDEHGTVRLHRLHPLEVFAMNLWEHPHWRGSPFQGEGVDAELLNDLAGNMWSLHHLVPLTMAACGAVPWSRVARIVREAKSRDIHAKKAVVVDSVSGSDSN